MSDIYIINEAHEDEETNVSVRFELVPTIHAARSQAAGRPVYEDTPVAFIRVKDDETQSRVPQLVTDDIKRRFPRQWAAFEAETADIADGTPLRVWPAISPAKVKELVAAGIRTVEELSDASDKQIGADADAWRQRAREWLDLAGENERLKAELAAMKAQKVNRAPSVRREEAA